jgi:hypothetical protein
VGVKPVYFLKAVLKEDLELKPTSYKISKTVNSFLLDFLKFPWLLLCCIRLQD